MAVPVFFFVNQSVAFARTHTCNAGEGGRAGWNPGFPGQRDVSPLWLSLSSSTKKTTARRLRVVTCVSWTPLTPSSLELGTLTWMCFFLFETHGLDTVLPDVTYKCKATSLDDGGWESGNPWWTASGVLKAVFELCRSVKEVYEIVG